MQVASSFVERYGEGVRRFFAPSTVMKLLRRGETSISVVAFQDYVRVKDYLGDLSNHVASHDLDGDGYLTLPDIESLLLSLAGVFYNAVGTAGNYLFSIVQNYIYRIKSPKQIFNLELNESFKIHLLYFAAAVSRDGIKLYTDSGFFWYRSI